MPRKLEIVSVESESWETKTLLSMAMPQGVSLVFMDGSAMLNVQGHNKGERVKLELGVDPQRTSVELKNTQEVRREDVKAWKTFGEMLREHIAKEHGEGVEPWNFFMYGNLGGNENYIVVQYELRDQEQKAESSRYYELLLPIAPLGQWIKRETLDEEEVVDDEWLDPVDESKELTRQHDELDEEKSCGSLDNLS